MDAILFGISVWIIIPIVAAIVARNKGRSAVAWFFICLLLSPLAILVLLVLESLAQDDPQPVRLVEAPQGDSKICPQCAEAVKAAAKVCRFCRYEFPSEPQTRSLVQRPIPVGFVKAEGISLYPGLRVFVPLVGEGVVVGPGSSRDFIKVRYAETNLEKEEEISKIYADLL